MNTSDYQDVLWTKDGARVTITMNRPERLNAFRGQTIVELVDAFERAADDESVGVIVLTGAGDRAFCVGGDVQDPSSSMAQKRWGHHMAERLASAMRNNGKPIIARVKGYCIGGGNELNMVCDLTIAAESARFGQAGPKIGTAPLWWGCQYAPLVIGEKRARELLFLVRQYDAHQALQMGLCNAVVPDDQLDAEVDQWCDEILAKSPQGLRLAKIGLNASSDLLYSSVQHGYELMALNHVHGDEVQEGIGAFQAKRSPDWRRFRGGEGPEPAPPRRG